MVKLSKTALIGAIGISAIAVAIILSLQSAEKIPSNASSATSPSAAERTKARPTRIHPDRSKPSGSQGDRIHHERSTSALNGGQVDATLNPAKAKELLERYRDEEKNIEVRADKTAQIIAQLCRNGFTKEAWSLIESDPGVVREKSLSGFFREATLPENEMISRLGTLEKKERLMGLTGYWSRFEPETFARLDLGKFGLHTTEDRVALRQTLESMLAKAFDPANPDIGKSIRQDLLRSAVYQANAGTLVVGDIGKILDRDPSKDGFAYWEALERIDPALRKGQDTLKGTDAVIIRAMVTQDPERTLNMTLVTGTPARGKGYVALEKWLTQDFNKASEWYHRNADRADPDSSAVAFMRACATRGDYQAALDWYAKIQSESWKNGIGGEMRSIQRRLDAEVNQ